MKTIKLWTGGHPLLNDNFQHLSEGVVESFEALVSAYGDNFKLWGVDVVLSDSDNTATWTDGAVVIDGEICLIAAGSITKAPLHVFVFTVAETHLGIDPQVYADATSHNVHKVRTAVIVGANFLSAAPRYNMKSLADLVNGRPETYSYDAGDFTTDSLETWTPTSGAFVKITASFDLKKALLNFEVTASAVTGSDVTELRFTIPAGLLAAPTADAHGFAQVGSVPGRMQIDAGSNILIIQKLDAAVISGATTVRGQIQFFIG